MAGNAEFIRVHPQQPADSAFAVGLVARDACNTVLVAEWKFIGNFLLDYVDRVVFSGMGRMALDAGFVDLLPQGRRTFFDMACGTGRVLLRNPGL